MKETRTHILVLSSDQELESFSLVRDFEHNQVVLIPKLHFRSRLEEHKRDESVAEVLSHTYHHRVSLVQVTALVQVLVKLP